MMSNRLAALGGLAALALAACTAQPAAPAEVSAREPVAPAAPGTAGPAEPPPADQCRASERQDWIGQSVDSLPDAPPSETWRVVCTSCDRTDDFRPDRLNIEHDEATRRIEKVSCG
ncbi:MULTISPECIES: hypothetical protein [Brevundimonas]|uniref:Peptidase inhibitor I78 n=1 Tax=Brevundimonas abyssalis TAR-001 TaxID=1391729 RepID=A0A8E0NDR7_9CAUL|nr:MULTISPECIES: hypothetical protein [Brevundimonas]GAD60509.1 hypothetical protein MBEBAB_2759 [Brevundimonas abyssalis TAR-001]